MAVDYEAEDALAKFDEMLDSFEHLLRINRNNLDTEIETQPDLFFRASEIAAAAASYRDRAKYDLSIIEASSSQLIRSTDADKGRVTEGAVKEKITLDGDVRAAGMKFLSWKKAADEWDAMKDAIEQRSRMLRDLANLYAAGYFTITSGGKAQDVNREARAEEARQKMHEKRSERPSIRRQINA